MTTTSNATSSNQQQNQNQSQFYQSKEIESFIESSWITIKDKETKVLEFIPGKTKVVDKIDFNGKPQKKVQYVVVVLTQMGNNFDYLHRLHFLASFLYMS